MDKDLLPIFGQKQVQSIGRTALGMIAVGLTAGLTLIAAAKRFGELIAEDDDERKQAAE